MVLYSVCGAWFLFLSTGQFKLLDVTVLGGQPEGEGCCVLSLVIVEPEVKRFGPRVMHSLCYLWFESRESLWKMSILEILFIHKQRGGEYARSRPHALGASEAPARMLKRCPELLMSSEYDYSFPHFHIYLLFFCPENESGVLATMPP